MDNWNYGITTSVWRKAPQLCCINMLQQYHAGEKSSEGACAIANVTVGRDSVIPSGVLCSRMRYANVSRETVSETDTSARDFELAIHPVQLGNFEVLKNSDSKLRHLGSSQRLEVISLIKEYSNLFPDVLGSYSRAKGMMWTCMGDANPIKQHPCRTAPKKQ